VRVDDVGVREPQRLYHWVVQSIVSALMPVSSAIRVLPKLQACARSAAYRLR